MTTADPRCGSALAVLVELMGRYSRYPQQMKRNKQTLALQAKTWSERTEPGTEPVRRVSFRLSEDDIEALVACYKAGSTGRELAAQFGIARSTVIELLKAHGVEVRHPRMSPSEQARAVELYRGGMTQKDIAAQLGRSPSVIWHVLQRQGVVGKQG